MSGREWSYWTRNKLQILTDYLPEFNKASQKSKERVYLDLMAGQPVNIDRITKERFDGSPVIALNAVPGFTRLRFGELGARARKLQTALDARYPKDTRYRVVEGDCNETIDAVLSELADVRWAPTFAFLDQQAAELSWETIVKVAQFRRNKSGWKTEFWLLMSPAMIAREARRSAGFRARVSRLYGNDNWLRILRALDRRDITPGRYRAEMVNLMRHQLEDGLGYRFTHRIPMRMHNLVEIFDMVFATDHEAGDRIMRHLYNLAAQREPQMMLEAKAAKAEEANAASGQFELFEPGEYEFKTVAPETAGSTLWRPADAWNPETSDWWWNESQPYGRDY